MTQVFEQIKGFYKSGWTSLKPLDLGMACSATAMSLSTGRIELSYFDGYLSRRKTIAVPDRLEAAETLQSLAGELVNRVRSLSQSEIEDLDRVQRVLAGASELPKRLDDSNL
ncbi:hypothetical protein H6F89_28460 [Cyanobacteria bacterium FACHB-63]|nr:hypothetical protein [Cyanobacteria bacterium FACHB-63]